MIKYGALLIAFFMSCMMASAEYSKKELKEFSRLVRLDGVTDKTDKDHGVKTQVITIDYSDSNDEKDYPALGRVMVRGAFEITDKETKQSYVFLINEPKDVCRNPEYEGSGWWEVLIPYGRFSRIEVSAYALQFGLMDGDVFVPFEEDFDDVKTYEELMERTKTAYPFKCKINRHIYVTI